MNKRGEKQATKQPAHSNDFPSPMSHTRWHKMGMKRTRSSRILQAFREEKQRFENKKRKKRRACQALVGEHAFQKLKANQACNFKAEWSLQVRSILPKIPLDNEIILKTRYVVPSPDCTLIKLFTIFSFFLIFQPRWWQEWRSQQTISSPDNLKNIHSPGFASRFRTENRDHATWPHASATMGRGKKPSGKWTEK